MAKGSSRRRKRLVLVAITVAMAVLAVMGFGLSGHDEAALRTFAASVDRWQHHPEFRTIAIEYCEQGSAAVDTHPWSIPTRWIVMDLRSLPLLPKKFAVNPTSQAHYTHFSQGPLTAYLHLCGEQSVPDVVGVIERAAADPAHDGPAHILDSFKMDFPVATDSGALNSTASLLHDTRASGSFQVRSNIGDLLRPHIAAIALELGFPTDPSDMTPLQQRAVLDRLDDYIRQHDPELWRTKQVSDYAGGIWAQVFGPPYNMILKPVLLIHDISRVVFVAVLILLTGRLLFACKAEDQKSDA